MEQTTLNKEKEIEWLMGSIKRDYACNRTMTIVFYIGLIIILALLIWGSVTGQETPGGLSLPGILFWLFMGTIFLIEEVLGIVMGKRIEKIDDARQMLKIYDQKRTIERVLLPVAIVFVFAFLYFYFEDQKSIVLNFTILLIIMLRLQTDKLIWRILGIIFSVCLIFMGEVFGGILMLVLFICSFVFGADNESPMNDQPVRSDFEKLRELLKDSE